MIFNSSFKIMNTGLCVDNNRHALLIYSRVALQNSMAQGDGLRMKASIQVLVALALLSAVAELGANRYGTSIKGW